MTVYDIASKLPSIAALRDRCRALAMLSAIFEPDQDAQRYHWYSSTWSPGVEVGGMDNGSGDCYWVVFDPAGVYIQGFDHESPMSPFGNDGEPWPGVVDDVPEVFSEHVGEPAFRDHEDVPIATVCLWREKDDDRWRHGDIEFLDTFHAGMDGADALFGELVGTAEHYRDRAEDRYECEVDLDAVEAVFSLRPLTSELVSRINPETGLDELAEHIGAIGYPR